MTALDFHWLSYDFPFFARQSTGSAQILTVALSEKLVVRHFGDTGGFTLVEVYTGWFVYQPCSQFRPVKLQWPVLSV